jgi:protein-S-isoprenylcysteine O-methyltransferase Ste14
MRATDFEYRHQTLFHLLVVGLAFLTYAFQRDDIVWALVRHHTTYRAFLERLVFGTGTLMIIGSATFQTWASAYGPPGTADGEPLLACDGPYRYVQYPLYFGRVLFALGIGLLAPAWGTVILLTGEILLVFRLFGRDHSGTTEEFSSQYRARVPRFLPSFYPRFPTQGLGANWKEALRKEASKWGLAVTMIVFTLTLQDRSAEILAAASFLFWLALNLPDFLRSNWRSSGKA